MTRSCSGKSSVGDSPVVPTGTRPSMPPLIWNSTCSRRRASSSRPSRNGVTRAVMAPLNMTWLHDGAVQGVLHLAHRVPESDEYRPADDRVADVQLADPAQRGDVVYVDVVQRVARVELHPGGADALAGGGHPVDFPPPFPVLVELVRVRAGVNLAHLEARLGRR